MLKKFYILSLIAFCLSGEKLVAQELNASVQINAQKVQATNKQIFKTLETAIREFLNNRKWTEETYGTDERIQCQFIFTIESFTQPDRFSGDLQILYSRPVYMSDYRSPVLVHRDNKVDFTYIENSRLDFAIQSNLNNLTSILAYYTYVIIGMDRDTYEPNGGEEYYQKAQQIVGNAQGGQYSGWSSFEGNRNRFWLLDNLTSSAFRTYRTAMYQYHRLGLDLMYEPSQQKTAKQVMKNALLSLEEVNDKRRNSFVMQLFFDAKSQEIINVFSDGPPLQDLAALKEVLIELDANNSSKYEPMGRG